MRLTETDHLLVAVVPPGRFPDVEIASPQQAAGMCFEEAEVLLRQGLTQPDLHHVEVVVG